MTPQSQPFSCPDCGYDLTATAPDEPCPECGLSAHDRTFEAMHAANARRKARITLLAVAAPAWLFLLINIVGLVTAFGILRLPFNQPIAPGDQPALDLLSAVAFLTIATLPVSAAAILIAPYQAFHAWRDNRFRDLRTIALITLPIWMLLAFLILDRPRIALVAWMPN